MAHNISDSAIYEILIDAQVPNDSNGRLVYFYWNHIWFGFDESGRLAHKRCANLVVSRLSGFANLDGERLEVLIYRFEDDFNWQLDLVMTNGLSMTWQDHFSSEVQALDPFLETVGEIGVNSLVRPGNVIPFPKHRSRYPTCSSPSLLS